MRAAALSCFLFIVGALASRALPAFRNVGPAAILSHVLVVVQRVTSATFPLACNFTSFVHGYLQAKRRPAAAGGGKGLGFGQLSK